MQICTLLGHNTTILILYSHDHKCLCHLVDPGSDKLQLNG